MKLIFGALRFAIKQVDLRGEFPLWWDNKDCISSPSPLWEQIEGSWVVCVHIVEGWGAMPMLERWWLGHSSILWELRVQFFAQDFYSFLCFLGVRTDCKINCVPANLTLQSLEKLTFHSVFFFFPCCIRLGNRLAKRIVCPHNWGVSDYILFWM